MMSNIQKNRQREEAILLSLEKLGYLSTSQLWRLHDLKSHRNACRVLKNMEEYLSNVRYEEKIYYLNKNGRERVGSNVIRKKINKTDISHYLMRNDFYIYRKPCEWRIEQSVSVGNVKVIPDAIFTDKVLDGERYFFLEVDNEQKMVNNRNKIDRYRRIKKGEGFQNQFGYFPTLVWVTRSEVRKKELQRLCNGLKVEVYLWEEIK